MDDGYSIKLSSIAPHENGGTVTVSFEISSGRLGARGFEIEIHLVATSKTLNQVAVEACDEVSRLLAHLQDSVRAIRGRMEAV